MMDVATGTPRLGWIGLGKMGAPMCLHLLKAGHSVDVFDTLTSAMTAVEAEGATVAASARAVAESAAIIFVSLPNDGALRSLIWVSTASFPPSSLGKLSSRQARFRPPFLSRSLRP